VLCARKLRFSCAHQQSWFPRSQFSFLFVWGLRGPEVSCAQRSEHRAQTIKSKRERSTEGCSEPASPVRAGKQFMLFMQIALTKANLPARTGYAGFPLAVYAFYANKKQTFLGAARTSAAGFPLAVLAFYANKKQNSLRAPA
jgi:hypothetical protein